MTKISVYNIDEKVTGGDKWIGSDVDNSSRTKNFTPTKLAKYFNDEQIVNIGTPIQYTYYTVDITEVRPPRTLTFETEIGSLVPFSTVTTFLLSKYTTKWNDVSNYLPLLIGTRSIIYRSNNINQFGLYTINTVEPYLDDPNFFEVTVTYMTGNGSLEEDKDYMISLIDFSDGDIPTKTSELINDGEDGVNPFITLNDIPPSTTPNLQSVTDEGNTTTNQIIVESGQYKNSVGIVGIRTESTTTGASIYLSTDDGIVISNASGSGRIKADNITLGNNPDFQLPNKSGAFIIATIDDIPAGGLTSVGLSMPIAFNVANSPLTSDGTIAVSAAGTSSQYIRGDGQLATMPSGGGGGSSVNYYLNGSIAASVATYKQLSNTAIIGAGTDFSLTGNGLITQFLTDVGNPNRIEIPGGAWNIEMWFSMSSNGGTPKFYIELLKYNGTTFTSIANSSAVPESITGGTSIDLYLTSLAVPTTTLLSTDRLAIRVYIVDNSGGRTATLHTEDNHLCEILTTFSGGVTSLNGLTANTQYLAVGTAGTDFNINSLVDTHTFNLPTASATNRGALSTTDWTAFNGKFTLPALTSGSVLFSNGTTIAQDNTNFFWDDTNKRLNIGGVTSNTASVGIKAPGSGAANVALRVRNSVDTLDLFAVAGDGSMFIRSRIALGSNADNISASSNSGFLDLNTNVGIKINPGSAFSTLFHSTGNVLIGTTVNQGGKLQIKAPGALSTDIALRVRNSADSADLFKTVGTGTSTFGDISGNAVVVSPSSLAIEFYSGVSRITLFREANDSFSIYRYGFTTLIANFGSTGVLIGGTARTDLNASAKLQADSTTQGFLPPRMTTTQKNAIATPATGLIVYDLTTNKACCYNGTSWNDLF